MKLAREYRPVLDHIEAAVEAACGALVSLESLDIPAATPNAENVQGHVAKAIFSMRHAIAELRNAGHLRASGLDLGFVLAREGAAPGGDASTGQSRLRRTA